MIGWHSGMCLDFREERHGFKPGLESPKKSVYVVAQRTHTGAPGVRFPGSRPFRSNVRTVQIQTTDRLQDRDARMDTDPGSLCLFVELIDSRLHDCNVINSIHSFKLNRKSIPAILNILQYYLMKVG